MLQQLGYENVAFMAGGFDAWMKAGFSVHPEAII